MAAPPLDAKRLVTSVSGLMIALDCGRDKAYAAINSGEVESFLDGRRRRIVVKSIEDYVARKVAAATKGERGRYPVKHVREAASQPESDMAVLFEK